MTPLYAVAKAIPQWVARFVLPNHVRGKENIPKSSAAILCINHQRYSDPIRLFLSCHRQIYFLAKEELFTNPFVSWVLHSLGVISIARGKGDVGAMNLAGEHLKKGGLLGVFIEGTRSKDGSLGRPKAGAAMMAWRYHVPVIPCCITAKGGHLPETFHWTYVSYGKPITPEELGLETGKAAEFRTASRLIMEQIAALRERDLKAFDK